MPLNNPESSLDALLTAPEVWGCAASPDGRWVAWTWMGVSPALSVHAALSDGSSQPVALALNDQNAWLVSWLPDSSGCVIAQDTDGDEKAELFRVDLAAPNVLHRLTEPRPEYYIHGGDLHPNGRWLIYSANIDDAGQVIEGSWIYRHDLTSGERLPLARPAGATFYPPSLNRQGTTVLYYRQDEHPSGQQLWRVGIDGEDDREIFSAGANRKASGVWFPDGERILVRAETDSHYRVGVWSPQTASVRWLIDDPARNIEDITFPVNSRWAVLHESAAARYRPVLLDVELGDSVRGPALDDDRTTVIPIAPAAEGGWTALVYGGGRIDDLVRMAPDGSAISLSRASERAAISADDLIPAEDFRWNGDDGLEIQGWLYRARGAAVGTIVYVHGGPTWHLEDRFDLTEQFFAGQGFHVLAPNYRGSTGFSRPYQEAIKIEGWGGAEQNDIRAGVEALIAAGLAQPGRVGITGTSYGGYSSWCAITRYPTDLIAAAAPICGMTDLVADYELTRPDLRPYSAEMMGGTPDEAPERFAERSPVNHVVNIRGRLLIVQGEQDPNVTPEQVSIVREALDKAGIPYEVLMFPDEGHGIHRRPNQRALLLRLLAFFQQSMRT